MKAKLRKCPRQQEILHYLFMNGDNGKSESDILFNVYNVDRSLGMSNKAGADCLRRALRNGFIKRVEVSGKRHKFEYFINI